MHALPVCTPIFIPGFINNISKFTTSLILYFFPGQYRRSTWIGVSVLTIQYWLLPLPPIYGALRLECFHDQVVVEGCLVV